MQETIQQSGSHGGITGEDSRPVLESDVLVMMMIEPRDSLAPQPEAAIAQAPIEDMMGNRPAVDHH